MSLLTLFQLNLQAAVGGPAKLVPIRQDWTSKPPLGTRLRTDGHWSTQATLASWGFQDGGGGIIRDLFGTENLTISGLSWANQGLKNTTSGQSATGASNTKTQLRVNHTLTFIITPLSGDNTVFYSDGVIELYRQYGAFDNELTYSVSTGAGTYYLNFPSSVVNGQTYIIACVYTGSMMYMYVNGVLAGSRSGPGLPPLYSGNTSPTFLSGAGASVISFCSLQNRALSFGEACSITANPWQIFEPRITWTVIPGSGGTTFPVTYFDLGYALDTCSCTVTAPLIIAEFGAALDSLAETAGIGETVTETGKAIDSDLVAGQGFSLAENGNALDTLASSMTAPVTISEIGNALDNLAAAAGIGAVITESGKGADILSASASYVLIIAEQGNAHDAQTAALTAGLTVLETGAIADIIYGGSAHAVSLFDSGAAVDIVLWGTLPAYYSNLTFPTVALLSQLTVLPPAAVARLVGILCAPATTVAKVTPILDYASQYPGTITPIQ